MDGSDMTDAAGSGSGRGKVAGGSTGCATGGITLSRLASGTSELLVNDGATCGELGSGVSEAIPRYDHHEAGMYEELAVEGGSGAGGGSVTGESGG